MWQPVHCFNEELVCDRRTGLLLRLQTFEEKSSVVNVLGLFFLSEWEAADL